MNLSRASIIAIGAALMAMACTGEVRADCLNSHAVDNCLIGTWQQTGGGAAEWMRQNLKMAQVGVTANALMTFNGDGTFSTSKADASAHVVAKEGRPMEATGQMSSEGSGQWSIEEGKLNLCMSAVNSSGKVQMQGPNGMATKVPMPQMKPAATALTYTCDGNTLSTVQPMPRNTTMTTTYTRMP